MYNYFDDIYLINCAIEILFVHVSAIKIKNHKNEFFAIKPLLKEIENIYS
jgi:hypothetical protein